MKKLGIVLLTKPILAAMRFGVMKSVACLLIATGVLHGNGQSQCFAPN